LARASEEITRIATHVLVDALQALHQFLVL